MSDSPASRAGAELSGAHAALGRVPSGLYILTIGSGDEATGLLVSWAQQAGFQPPSISLALQQGREVLAQIESGEPFVLNVVGEGQTPFLKHFGKGFEPGEPAFEGVPTEATPAGVVALAEAHASLECRALGGVDVAEHRLVVAEVTHGVVRSDIKPMIHVRKRGDRY